MKREIFFDNKPMLMGEKRRSSSYHDSLITSHVTIQRRRYNLKIQDTLHVINDWRQIIAWQNLTILSA